MKNNYNFYNIVSKVSKFFGDLYFGGKVYGKENIPKSGACILAGNHVGNYDAYMLYKGTNRPIHFLAKKELLDKRMGWFFKRMHLIPVDRKDKNPIAVNSTIELLNNEKVIGIFPEGTYHKKDILLPFKPGVISFALKTDAPIIPFAIVGKFKLLSHPKIVFGKPIYIKKVKQEDKVKYLEDIIRNMILEEKNNH